MGGEGMEQEGALRGGGLVWRLLAGSYPLRGDFER